MVCKWWLSFDLFFLGRSRPVRSAHSPLSALASCPSVSLSSSWSISIFCLTVLHTSVGDLLKWAPTALMDSCSVLFCLQCTYHFSHYRFHFISANEMKSHFNADFISLYSADHYHLGVSHVSLQSQSRHFLKFSFVFYSNLYPKAYSSNTAFRTGKRSP